MARILVRNGMVVDPSQNIENICDILIEDGKIIKVAPNIVDQTDRVIEAKNMLVLPGLVDMHVHLRDPGFTQKEDIYTGSNAALAGGFSSILCMPNTNPVIDCEEVIDYISNLANTAKTRVYMCGAITEKMQGEKLVDFSLYKKKGIIAVSDDGRPVENEELMKAAMISAYENDLPIISHCEDLAIIDGGIINKGLISQKLEVKGMDRASENNITQREIRLAKETNTAIHIAHVSTKEAVESIRQAKKEGVRVTCETAPHYFSFTQDKLLTKDADFRMNPPLREQADVDAIIEGIKDKTIDCIATDHAPHTKKDKEDFLNAPNGVTGLETSLSAGIQFLVKEGHITLSRLIELMAYNPAKILKLNAGSLKVGMQGDIVIVSPKVNWTVLPEKMISKSKNTAFKFQQLQGRVKYTMLDGEIAYVLR